MGNARKSNILLRQQRLVRGWSLERVAEEVQKQGGGADSKMVGKWERGVVKPRPYYQEMLVAIYGVKADQLGFVDRPAEEAPSMLAPPTQDPGPPLSTVDLFEISMQGLSLVQQQQHYSTDELLAHVGQSLRRIEMQKQGQDGGTYSRREALTFLVGLPAALFALTRRGNSSPLFAEEVVPLYAAGIPACWRLYFAGGMTELEQILPEYLSHLSIVAQQPSRHQQLAAGLASQAYQLDWLLALQHQDFGKALTSIKQAFQYSNIADDDSLRASALIRQAHVFFHLKRPLQQVQLHQKTMQYCSTISPLLRGWLYIVSAESYANPEIGNDAEARRLLSMARDTFPDYPENDPNFSYVPINHYTLANHEVLTHLHLKEAKEAWNILAAIEKTIPTTLVPRRVELLSRQTAASLVLDDMDQTCSYFESATVAAKALGSELRYNEVCETYAQMQVKWPYERRVQRLAELLEQEEEERNDE